MNPNNPSSSSFEAPNNHNSDLITLGDVLNLFGMNKLLEDLDKSLEKVRRHLNPKENHEEYLKTTDKKIQKLSLKYHPDKVKSKGGSDEELSKAENIQTALNATRIILKSLTEMFLKNLDIDYRYEFYTKIELSLLGNEDESKRIDLNILKKLVMLSEIKQTRIIAIVKEFLIISNDALDNFIKGDMTIFLQKQDKALFYLEICIDGYQKLLDEFSEVEKDFVKDENLKAMNFLIKKMAKESSSQLKVLLNLEKQIYLLKENFQVFAGFKKADEYFVLPFVKYITILLICAQVITPKKKKSKKSLFFQWLYSIFTTLNPIDGKQVQEYTGPKEIKYIESKKNPVDSENWENMYTDAYNLASEINNCKTSGKEKTEECLEGDMIAFKELVIRINDKLKNEFKLDSYIEGGTSKYILSEYIKWTSIMDNYLEKEDERIKNTWVEIKNNKTEIEKLTEELNECSKFSR